MICSWLSCLIHPLPPKPTTWDCWMHLPRDGIFTLSKTPPDQNAASKPSPLTLRNREWTVYNKAIQRQSPKSSSFCSLLTATIQLSVVKIPKRRTCPLILCFQFYSGPTSPVLSTNKQQAFSVCGSWSFCKVLASYWLDGILWEVAEGSFWWQACIL